MRRSIILSLLVIFLCSTGAYAQQATSGRKARRIDRGINTGIPFGYKGEVIMGTTASYGTLSSEDSNILVYLDNINIDGTITTVKPFIGYFYRDNRCIGVRFGYQYIDGDLGNLNLDLGEKNDISMSVEGLQLINNSMSASIFHRSYVSLDNKGRFGLFAEIEASAQMGKGEFLNSSGETPKYTKSENMKFELGFNPGVAVYVFPSVCATVSIGLGGVRYASISQYDELNNKVGTREASKMQFRLNVADINFGMVIHLWSKKKK